VEDNEINQQVAREILEGAGLVVAIAGNGREALEAVKRGGYDAVLMDVQMPVMDGYTATRKIREWESVSAKAVTVSIDTPKNIVDNPESSIPNAVPIIAMTAHAMADDAEKSLQAGMNGHVAKPIDPAQLFAALAKWIKPADGRRSTAPRSVAHGAAAEDRSQPREETLPPSLPGFDLEAGLERLMGNKGLYRKLLLDFGSNYTGVAGDIRKTLDSGDFKQAHSLVHNLKGLAGNLAAVDLQAAAVAMEKLVKGESGGPVPVEPLNQKFGDLENAVARALAAVQTLGAPADPQPAAFGADTLTTVSPGLIKDLVNNICM
jgi:CheY-like chemotaxis protein